MQSLETYAHMVNNGKKPSASDFEGSYPNIIERFIYNLDKDTVEVLRLMSIPNYYDNDIFDSLIKKFNVSYPLTEFVQFNKYSFVTYDEAEGVYHIHDFMRKGILENTPEQVIVSAHRHMCSYYERKIGDNIVIKHVLEMFYHARNCMNVDEFNSWLVTPFGNNAITPLQCLKRQQERGELTVLNQIFNGIIYTYSLSSLNIELVNIYIDIIHLQGNYKEAYKESESYLTGKDIRDNIELQKLFCRKIHYGMLWKKPVELLSELGQKKVDDFYSTEVKCEYLIAKYNLLTLAGRFDEALSTIKEVEPLARELYDSDKKNWLRVQRKKIDLLAMKGDFNLPDELFHIDIDADDMITRYEIYILGSMAENYRQTDKLDKAEYYYKALNKLCNKKKIKGWLAHSFLGLAAVDIQQGKYEEAKTNLKSANDIYTAINQNWGILNVLILYCFITDRSDEKYIKELNEAISYSTENGYSYYFEFLNKIDDFNNIKYFRLLFL